MELEALQTITALQVKGVYRVSINEVGPLVRIHSAFGMIYTSSGKVEWPPDKIGQAGKCKPGNYFVADNTEALDLSTFTITVWVKFSKDTDGAEQNIVHKQEGKDRSTRSYTIKIWEGMAFCIFASTSDDDAVKLSY